MVKDGTEEKENLLSLSILRNSTEKEKVESAAEEQQTCCAYDETIYK